MKTPTILSVTLSTVGLALAASNASAFELTKIIQDNKNGISSLRRCKFTGTQLMHQTVLGSLETTSIVPITANVSSIDDLVAKAVGIPLPQPENYTTYTKWWVKVDGASEAKLVRANVLDVYGHSTVTEDTSLEGRELARFIGDTCNIF